MSRANGSPPRSAWSETCCSIRRTSSLRLGIPVSESCSDCRSFSREISPVLTTAKNGSSSSGRYQALSTATITTSGEIAMTAKVDRM